VERVLVLQSFNESTVTGWLGRCVDSVRAWCGHQGYDYRQRHDSLFELLPDWYRDKVGARKPIAADLARLLWIRDELQRGEFDLVAWLDADVLVMTPGELSLRAATTCTFGQEHWVQMDDGKLRIHKNVHNAYCAFRPGCPILPFLIEAVQRMVRRVDPRFMAPQFVGPKLLTHLHNTVGFELDPRFGALSPELVAGLLRGDDTPYQTMLERMPEPLMAANLCASLQGHTPDSTMQCLIERLL
jgi:hypothetical protein